MLLKGTPRRAALMDQGSLDAQLDLCAGGSARCRFDRNDLRFVMAQCLQPIKRDFFVERDAALESGFLVGGKIRRCCIDGWIVIVSCAPTYTDIITG